MKRSTCDSAFDTIFMQQKVKLDYSKNFTVIRDLSDILRCRFDTILARLACGPWSSPSCVKLNFRRLPSRDPRSVQDPCRDRRRWSHLLVAYFRVSDLYICDE